MWIIVEIVIVVLVTDFLSGVLHWLEDSYGDARWPVTGRLVTRPNILHHRRPTAFTEHSWLKSASVLLFLATVILAVTWAGGVLTWHVLLLVALGVNANEIHKWNHLPASKRGRIVVALRKLSLLQTPQHHGRHHSSSKNTNYCVITNFVNPVLEVLDIWRKSERAIEVLLGVSKRPDPPTPMNLQQRIHREIPQIMLGQ